MVVVVKDDISGSINIINSTQEYIRYILSWTARATGMHLVSGHLPFFLSDPPRVRRFQDTGHGHIPDAENQLEICQCQYSKHSKGAIKPINLASSSLYPPFTLF